MTYEWHTDACEAQLSLWQAVKTWRYTSSFFITPSPDWGGWLTQCPGRFFPRKGTRLSFSDTDFWIESTYSTRRIKTCILKPERNCKDLLLMYLFCNRAKKCTYDITITYTPVCVCVCLRACVSACACPVFHVLKELTVF